jgi:glycosyltransferase involved in cell wall biosynthesis
LPWPAFASSWSHYGYAVQAAQEAKRRGCDVIHITNYTQFVPVVRRIHPKATILLHMQCEWLTQLDRPQIVERIRHADQIIGCSEYITRLIAAEFPEFASRCVTVPNAAALIPERPHMAEGQDILFVGRLSPEKGLHDLIDAFHLVLKQFPEARLHLVGGAGSAPLEFLVGLSRDPRVQTLTRFYPPQTGPKDPYFETLESMAGAEKDKRILFAGHVNHDQIEKHYDDAALLVNPSYSESFGISLVEAMMRSMPVVSTRIGGMTYTVDNGETGFLVEPGQPQELADALCKVLADRERARAMGHAGRRKAEREFTWDSTSRRFMEQAQRALEQRRV